MRASLLFTPFLAAAAVLAPAPARSTEANENRLREALRSASTQVTTLEDERARLQAADAVQKKEIEALKAQLAAASRKARAPAPSPELALKLAEQTEANQKLAADLRQCQAATSDASEAARSKEAERAKLAAQAGQLTQRATTCEGKNERIYKLTQEILRQCEKMGFADTLLAPLEPLTGLRRVKLENLSQEFQDRLLEQKVNP